MKQKTKIVGITGGIGSGKSTVCRVFQELGVPSYNADLEAKVLLNVDKELQSQIISLLGDKAYQKGVYNTVFVKEQVLSNPELLEALNQIIHPAVALHFKNWVLRQKEAPFLLKESALILSHNLKGYDHLIYVEAKKEERIARVLKRDSERNEEEIKHIMDLQQQDREDKRINFIVSNNQEDKVLTQCLKIFKELSS